MILQIPFGDNRPTVNVSISQHAKGFDVTGVTYRDSYANDWELLDVLSKDEKHELLNKVRKRL